MVEDLQKGLLLFCSKDCFKHKMGQSYYLGREEVVVAVVVMIRW